jgi:hypothetical protein
MSIYRNKAAPGASERASGNEAPGETRHPVGRVHEDGGGIAEKKWAWVSLAVCLAAERADVIWDFFKTHPKIPLPRSSREAMILVELARLPAVTVGRLHIALAERGLKIPIPSLYQTVARFVVSHHVRLEDIEEGEDKGRRGYSITQVGRCAVAYFEAVAKSEEFLRHEPASR